MWFWIRKLLAKLKLKNDKTAVDTAKAKREEKLWKLLEAKIVGLDYYLRVSDLPALEEGEWEPEKTTAQLRNETDAHYQESKVWIERSLENEEERTRQLTKLSMWYHRQITSINTKGWL